MLKSVAVVLGAYILSIVLVFATNPLLKLIFPGQFDGPQPPSNAALIVSTGFFFVVSILCAWLCARFSPSPAAKHVLWLFILGELMGLGFTIPNWSKNWPHWYWISWLVVWPISCYMGLTLANRRTV